MCQLTLGNISMDVANKLFLILATNQNPLDGHQDGTGFFSCETGVQKTAVPGNLINNLDTFMGKVSSPAILHVRKASWEYNKPEQKTAEKAHPFESTDFVLAHNGTLTLKDLKDKEKYKNDIDSEIFLKNLQDEYDKDKTDFLKALQETYKLFRGKFAFLIYKKDSSEFFVVRGKTATLFKANISINNVDCGYVINTVDKDLNIVLLRLKNIFNLIYSECSGKLDYTLSAPIEENAVFLVEKDSLTKIGVLKEEENFFPVVATAGTTVYGVCQNHNSLLITPRNTGKVTIEVDKAIEVILKFLADSTLNIFDLDELLFHITGRGLLYSTKEDILTVATKIIPYLSNRITSNDTYIDRWLTIASYSETSNPYKEYSFQFPYMLEPYKNIRSTAKVLLKKNATQEKYVKEIEYEESLAPFSEFVEDMDDEEDLSEEELEERWRKIM